MTDPIADCLTRIRNAQRAGHAEVQIPFSRIKLELVKLLYQEGFLSAYRLGQGVEPHHGETGQKRIEVSLRYVGKKKPIITELKRMSRPGRRTYVGYGKIPVIRSGMGFVILSTSRGLMTDRQAREAKVGGEVLCSVW